MAPLPPQRQRSLSPLAANRYIYNILLALPPKSLLRFKSLSKLWCSVISKPEFRDVYYAMRASSSVPRFFFQCSSYDYHHSPPGSAALHRFATLDSDGLPLDVLPIRVVGGPIKLVVPSSRGLLCFATETCVYLCNPTTHSLIQLPPLAGGGGGGGGESIAGFGFGYMESTMEYKVARLVHKGPEGYYLPCKLECSVFTYPVTKPAVTNAWKVLPDACPYFVAEYGMPVFVRGTETIYWKIDRDRHCECCSSKARGRQDDLDFLVYLDIKKERFGVVRGPQGWRAIPGSPPRLLEANIARKLCMVETEMTTMMTRDSPLQVVVWLLTDQQKSHWVRQAIVPLPPMDLGTVLGEIKECKGDRIIFSTPDDCIIFFNPKAKTFRKVDIPPGLHNMDFCTYTENLLTLRLPP